jgi:hypothetical protein
MIEPRCLIDTEGRAPLFQGSFVGHGKWFRGHGASGRGEVRAPVHADGLAPGWFSACPSALATLLRASCLGYP